jgi:hypothetical protein
MSDSRSRGGTCSNITIIVIFTIISMIILLCYWLDYTLFKPQRIGEHIHKSIYSLITKCPPNMNEDEWEAAVGWTYQLSGNSSLIVNVNASDLGRFQRELDERIKVKVDMNLILWIWDEHAKLTPCGKNYKQNYQKRMLDEMQQAAKGNPQNRWFTPDEKRISP